MLENDKLNKNYCEYLSFRSFYTGYSADDSELIQIQSLEGAIDYLTELLAKTASSALLLSGGMDSAVILPFMPKGSTAYTIYHDHLEDNEVENAKNYCKKFSVNHVAITIDPDEYFAVVDGLMLNKKMPLSPAEPIIYLAAMQAQRDGFEKVVTGAGADYKFGGFSRLRKLRSSSQFRKKIQKRYHDPKSVLNSTISLKSVFDNYLIPGPKLEPTRHFLFRVFQKKTPCVIDSKSFLNEVGLERFAFNNAISLAGCQHIAPFNQSNFSFIEEINSQRPKYFIQDLYAKTYGRAAPVKSGLQKPTHLLSDYSPANLDLFRSDIDFDSMSFQKKFLIYSLERFEALRLEGKVNHSNLSEVF